MLRLYCEVDLVTVPKTAEVAACYGSFNVIAVNLHARIVHAGQIVRHIAQHRPLFGAVGESDLRDPCTQGRGQLHANAGIEQYGVIAGLRGLIRMIEASHRCSW